MLPRLDPPAAPAEASAATAHHVTLQPSQSSFEVAAGETILEAALRAGAGLPSSCRNGTCRACICRCIVGRFGYRIAWPGLSAEEKADGWLLPCVALPWSDLLLDAPRARPPAAAAAAPPFAFEQKESP